MKLASINVGLPREITWNGKAITTGIFKEPVAGPVPLRRHNLEGDGQADLSVHGGPTKAVYVYPAEHYDFWRAELGEPDLSWGGFGENFTVTGARENAVFIGDEYRVGSARVIVTEPRMPCYKLAIRLERPDIGKTFLQSLRTGFYLGVVEEGVVEAGDTLERVAEYPDRLSIADVASLYTTEKNNKELLRKAISVEALPEGWREYFADRLTKL